MQLERGLAGLFARAKHLRESAARGQISVFGRNPGTPALTHAGMETHPLRKNGKKRVVSFTGWAVILTDFQSSSARCAC